MVSNHVKNKCAGSIPAKMLVYLFSKVYSRPNETYYLKQMAFTECAAAAAAVSTSTRLVTISVQVTVPTTITLPSRKYTLTEACQLVSYFTRRVATGVYCIELPNCLDAFGLAISNQISCLTENGTVINIEGVPTPAQVTELRNINIALSSILVQMTYLPVATFDITSSGDSDTDEDAHYLDF